MRETEFYGLYGTPPVELIAPPGNTVQFSPLVPGSRKLEENEGSLAGMIMVAPPGTVERRYTLAVALKALAPGASLTVLAPKDKGGSRLRKELEGFGCTVTENARRHYRICHCERPPALKGIDEAMAEGMLRLVDSLGLWSQPGVFSWDRVDPGSALLEQHLPPLAGHGADFGCGVGYLARAILASPKVASLALIDIDRRAIEAARRNIDDPRVSLHWADVRQKILPLKGLDFVVMNPPFHNGGVEDRALGQSFIQCAAEALRPGGVCWLVANRHLPYEAVLKSLFKRIVPRIETGGYKVYEVHR